MRRLTCLVVALALAGGAAAQPPPAQTPVGSAGPRLEATDFVSRDGAKLALQQWAPASGDPWAVIIGLHGMNDDSDAFKLAGPYWARDGILTIAYDQRGFGRSPRHGVWVGDALLVDDLRILTALVRDRYPRAILVVAGESLGATVAIEAFAPAASPKVDRLVLLSPAVWGWATQPPAYRIALRLGARAGPGAKIQPAWVTKRRPASDNVDEVRRMRSDPNRIINSMRVDALYDLVDSMQRASDALGQVRAPIAYLMGAHDEIIPARPKIAAARALKPTDHSALYPNGWHLLLIDQQREVVFNDVESFIRNPSAPLPSGAPIVPGSRTAANAPPTPSDTRQR